VRPVHEQNGDEGSEPIVLVRIVTFSPMLQNPKAAVLPKAPFPLPVVVID
jgi:hypothetical protein